MSPSLTPCCPVCSSKENLLRCQGCKVMPYCGREHQAAHRGEHKAACNGVKKKQQALDREEQKVRADQDWLNVFEEEVGHFWGIVVTRPYMRARFALVDAILKIKSFHAVQAARDHATDMLRLCRSDNMGVRELLPHVFLRLGKDQECYDCVKWYATTGQEPDYNWGDISLPYCDVKDADTFEPVDLFFRKRADLSHTVSITLLKIRLLLDVKSLQNSNVIGGTVPQELLDNIRGQLVSTIVAENKEIMDSKDQAPIIRKLESQVGQLFAAVKNANKYFWPALLRLGIHLTARPEYTSYGNPEEMQMVLQYSYDAWVETPGAIDMIKTLVKKDDAN